VWDLWDVWTVWNVWSWCRPKKDVDMQEGTCLGEGHMIARTGCISAGINTQEGTCQCKGRDVSA
jgi:hypothetical protein